MVLTTSNGEHGLFMFFCSFSLIFQSSCFEEFRLLGSFISVTFSPERSSGGDTSERSISVQAASQGESRSRMMWARWEQGKILARF